MNSATDEIREWAASAQGMLCWSVVAGGMTSYIGIDLGKQRRRARTLTNPHLTQAQREFGSDYSIFVEGAFWQLSQKDAIMTDANADCSPNGPLALGVQLLVGSHVTAVQFDSGTRSLCVDFEPGALKLQVRGDVVNGWNGCYSLFFPDRILAIEGAEGSRIEERDA